MGGLDRFVGNETGPPPGGPQGESQGGLSSTPHPSNQISLGSVVLQRCNFSNES